MREHVERWVVPADSARFTGHFPGDPIYPGVAQLLDWIVPRAEALSGRALLGARRVKFLAKIRPGDVLLLRLTQRVSGLSFEVSRADELVLSGQLLLKSPLSPDETGNSTQPDLTSRR